MLRRTITADWPVEGTDRAGPGPDSRATLRPEAPRIAAMIRRVDATDLNPNTLVVHGASIYDEILAVAEEAGTDLIVVGSHRPAMKDYLLGTNASRSCARLIARSWWRARRFHSNRKNDARSALIGPCRRTAGDRLSHLLINTARVWHV